MTDPSNSALKPSPRKLHFSIIIFFVCLLFTAVAWDHYFNSSFQFDRKFVSNLILLMGTLFSVSAGLFAWSLESRQNYLEKEVKRRTEELLRQEKETIAAEARAEEAHQRRQETEEAYHKLEETQDRLIQAEKLASIGRVVAGVAHELKNPLITLTGYANLLLESRIEGPERRFIEILHHQAKRCHQTVQDLLTYTHAKALRLEDVHLPALLDQVLSEMPLEFQKSGIEVLKNFPAQCPVIQADAAQLVRVFANILVNAWHALEEIPKGRRLTISILTAENGVQVFVADNGPGIAKENLNKIFDPFFTTKAVGKGTGLGLSLCYGIIREHGGTLALQSEIQKGTTCVVKLPFSPEKRQHTQTLQQDKRKILVADDEPAVLSFVADLLRAWGYEPVGAVNGREALEKAWIEHENISLGILDINMPEMDGLEVARRFGQDSRLNRIPLVFLTARLDEEEVIPVSGLKVKKYLRKPFQYQDLQAAIVDLLKA